MKFKANKALGVAKDPVSHYRFHVNITHRRKNRAEALPILYRQRGRLGYFLFVAHYYPDLQQRGLFGDSFGAFSALFTGLALAGTAYAIYRQDEQSVEHERQLHLQAELQTRTAIALERNSTIELVELISRMREKNAEDLTSNMRFIKSHAGDPDVASAIREATSGAKLAVTVQRLLGEAHKASIESLVKAWDLPPELAKSYSALSKPHDQARWEAMIDGIAAKGSSGSDT